MKLSQLLSIYPRLRWGENPTQDIAGLTGDSRQVQPGSVYVAVRGVQNDGHQYVGAAVEAGACALVVEDKTVIPQGFRGAVVVVDDSRDAINQLAARYYQQPADDLFCVGVTGTNGKTSITYMVERILNHNGWSTGVVGTVDHHLGEHHWPSLLTTPDGLSLNKRLHEFKVLGAKAAAVEVSSHALHQHRIDGWPLDVAVFTNLTRDHLDYHRTMQEYFAAKERLFNELLALSSKRTVYAIINGDDEWGRQLQVTGRAHTWYYGMHDVDLKFRVRESHFSGSVFDFLTPRGKQVCEIPIVGLHNVYNAVAAMGVGMTAGMSLQSVVEAMQQFQGVKGRLQRVGLKAPCYVFVDYAHTDDALRSVLSTLHEVRKSSRRHHKIITVFGCGGDRDKGKRPLMAQVACQWSDLVFITSDNPRSEDPEQIIADCKAGVPPALFNVNVFTEVDRRKAIQRALHMASQNDVVLIAGKGHEEYQIIGSEKHPFSDAKVVEELLV